MTRSGISLSKLGIVLILLSFSASLGASWLWLSSTQAWQNHLTRSYLTGIALFETLRQQTKPPHGLIVTKLDETDGAFASNGQFNHIKNAPKPSRETLASIHIDDRERFSGEILKLAILSERLQYSIATLPLKADQPAAHTLGNITKLLASYCSAPVIVAKFGNQPWVKIEGPEIWDCEAAPSDYRLLAVLVGLVSFLTLASLVLENTSQFDRFSHALKNRHRIGGPEQYQMSGPAELRDIVAAVNRYLKQEREQLTKRASVLSGVSHDLGTPATRLKLRAALIEDEGLRQKLESDIDHMTNMIDSVLTYTRSELSIEEPRKISLSSLVSSLVADYQDIGKPVSFRPIEPIKVEGGNTLFSSTTSQKTLNDQSRILTVARPLLLHRALTNLVDNALKYGRHAEIDLRASAEHVVISVEDWGSDLTADALAQLVGPFKRGENSHKNNGFGLGLTIVSTIAEQHLGRLYFEQGKKGLRACLQISR